jgi:hypothetical protein
LFNIIAYLPVKDKVPEGSEGERVERSITCPDAHKVFLVKILKIISVMQT